MFKNHSLVSINLLTYNGEKYIEDCLGSVFNQAYPYFNILIIDNGSTDRTVDYLKRFKNKSGLRIIYNKKNIGFAAGHNQGIRETQGEFILCLNQDVVLDKNFIRKAIKIFKKDNQVGAVQGRLLRWNIGGSILNKSINYDISHIIDTTGLVIFKNRRIVNRGQGEINENDYRKMDEIFGADGAAPIYRRKALEDVKIKDEYFDEDFFCYKEDVDLAWRLRLNQWKTIYQPKSIAWHDRTSGESATTGYLDIIKERLKISKFGKYYAFKNQRLMQIKNEQIVILLKHFPWFLPKEIASWLYILFFEKYTWQAIKALFNQMPNAWQKRKIIMNSKKASVKEMNKWFK